MATSNALVYYHELVKAGIPDEQAFNQAMAFDNAISHLATKEYLQHLETRTDSKFDLARQDLKTEIGLLRSEMSINHRWIMAFLIAGLGGIIGMLCK